MDISLPLTIKFRGGLTTIGNRWFRTTQPNLFKTKVVSGQSIVEPGDQVDAKKVIKHSRKKVVKGSEISS